MAEAVELEQYNAVNKKNFVIPRYNVLKKETSITLYFNTAGEVIIVGTAGEEYVFWLSVTGTEDVELNGQIFNHITNDELNYVTRLDKALAQKNIDYETLAGYYKVCLTQSLSPDIAWETPFGHGYSKSQRENNGDFFAQDVRQFVSTVRLRCGLREGGGAYVTVLEQYAAFLKSAEKYALEVQMLQELLQGEDYLVLSENEQVRKLYLECRERCACLYNQYMMEAR